MNQWEQLDIRLHHFGMSIVGFVVTVCIGIVIDRWVIGRVKRFAARTGWTAGEPVAKALSGAPTILAVLIGTANALSLSPLSPSRIVLANTAITAASIILITWVIERAVSGMLESYGASENALIPTTTIFNTIVKLVIYLIGALVAMHAVGISITPMITALGIGGLSIALALKDTLSNLFAGIQVILSKQITIGDYVQLGAAQEGYVVDINWRNTTIRTLANSTVIVPNGNVATGVITNFGRTQHELSFSVPMHVSYDSDLERIERLIHDVIATMQIDFSDKMPAVTPGIRYQGFGESSINVNAVLKVFEYEFQFEMRHEFVKRMHRVFTAEGIHIPYPTREIVRKGSTLGDDALE